MAFSAPFTLATILLAFSFYLLAPGMVFGDDIDFYNCDKDDFENKLSEVTSIDISGCEEDKCDILSGAKINVTVQFQPAEDYEELTLNLDVNHDMGTKHLIENEKLCGIDLECPLVAGTSALLERTNFAIDIPFYVPESMLKNLEMNATLTKKDTKNVVACVLFYLSVKKE